MVVAEYDGDVVHRIDGVGIADRGAVEGEAQRVEVGIGDRALRTVAVDHVGGLVDETSLGEREPGVHAGHHVLEVAYYVGVTRRTYYKG